MAYTGPSSKQLLEVISFEPTGANIGVVQYMIRSMRAAASGISYGPQSRQIRSSDPATPVVTAWLQGVLEAMQQGATGGGVFRHPRDMAHRKRQPRRTGDLELTPVELAWLQRLPADPEQVSFDDAVELAAMTFVDRGIGSPSTRLLNSHWLPVEAVFDRREAEYRLQEARRPLHLIPNPVPAVAAVIALEVDGVLTGSEIQARADRLVAAAMADRRERHQQRLDEANIAVQQVDVREAHRLSPSGGAA